MFFFNIFQVEEKNIHHMSQMSNWRTSGELYSSKNEDYNEDSLAILSIAQ
jgi:hypothetical protein